MASVAKNMDDLQAEFSGLYDEVDSRKDVIAENINVVSELKLSVQEIKVSYEMK